MKLLEVEGSDPYKVAISFDFGRQLLLRAASKVPYERAHPIMTEAADLGIRACTASRPEMGSVGIFHCIHAIEVLQTLHREKEVLSLATSTLDIYGEMCDTRSGAHLEWSIANALMLLHRYQEAANHARLAINWLRTEVVDMRSEWSIIKLVEATMVLGSSLTNIGTL